MDVSTERKAVRGNTCKDDEDKMYQPKLTCVKPGKEHVVTDGSGGIQKGVIYVNVLQIMQRL